MPIVDGWYHVFGRRWERRRLFADDGGRIHFCDDGQATHYFGYNNQGIQNTVSNSVPTQISKVDYDRLDRPVKVTRANKGCSKPNVR